ncbi:hypothetical protein GCM10009577_83130 [Streptomyces javensis]
MGMVCESPAHTPCERRVLSGYSWGTAVAGRDHEGRADRMERIHPQADQAGQVGQKGRMCD